MKKLIIVRHAKSSWEFNVIDHERPLKEKGKNDALLVSKYMKQQNLSIDKVISSDAVRAKSTANIFGEILDFTSIIELDHELYDFSGEALLDVIRNCNARVNSLMIFGHNHAITSFVNTYGNIYIDNVPTSGVVVIEFDVNDWKNLKQGITIDRIFPRDLK